LPVSAVSGSAEFSTFQIFPHVRFTLRFEHLMCNIVSVSVGD